MSIREAIDEFDFEHNGNQFRAFIFADNDHGAPWDEEEGHGPVSEWTTRDKRPGELILNDDRRQKRYYDFAEACRIARRDGWNAEPYDIPGETRRQRAAKAAMADFKRLRGWCLDHWSYVGIAVLLLDDDEDPIDTGNIYQFALWGIESDCRDYHREVAAELAAELLDSVTAGFTGHAA